MAGFSLSLLAVVAAVAWYATQPDDPYVAPPPEASQQRADPEAATRALDEVVGAVQRGDIAAAAALGVPDDAGSTSQLTALAANADALRIEELSLRYVDETTGVSAEGVWTAAADATWAFGGFDGAPSRAEVLVTFRLDPDEAGRVQVVSVGGGDRRTPVWMAGPVTVRRTARTLVVASGAGERIEHYQRVADAAVPVVRRVLPHWRPRLVVEVPADLAALDAALAVEPGTYSSIAAVTTTADGSLAPDSPVHVFVNPEVFDGLAPIGAQVVMSHEATHVATAAPSSMSPTWLLEGFADYVALRDVDLPVATTAAQIIRQVRRQGVPETLPGAQEFSTTDAHLGAAYEAAWLACVVLAEHAGEEALSRLYDATRDGGALGPALRRVAGWSERELVTAWQGRLAELAG